MATPNASGIWHSSGTRPLALCQYHEKGPASNLMQGLLLSSMRPTGFEPVTFGSGGGVGALMRVENVSPVRICVGARVPMWADVGLVLGTLMAHSFSNCSQSVSYRGRCRPFEVGLKSTHENSTSSRTFRKRIAAGTPPSS